MVPHRKMIGKFLHFLVISLLISSAGAQWGNPWITSPPPSSLAFGHVNVSASNNNLDAEENIAGNTILAVLNFTKGYNESFEPVLFSGCGSIIRLGPSNNGMMDIISLKEFDYDGGDNTSYECIFFISKPSTAIKSLSFNIKDLNDNRPFFDKYPNTALNFPENAIGSLYDFHATDGDKGDVSSLTYSFIALGGDGSNFTMNRQTGQFSVTKKLDYEAGQFYLFNMIVTDKGGLIGSTQVALNVIDEKDSAPVWKLEVSFKNISEGLPVNTPVFSVRAQDGDVTVNDEMVYSLVDPRSSFSIEPKTGQVRIFKVIDRDVDDFDSYFDLNITATCKNYPTFKSVTYSTVFIDDINDNIPMFDKSVYDFVDVDEDFKGRLSQMDILVSDPDLKDFGSYLMSIEGSTEIKSHLEVSPSSGRNNGIFSLRITSTGLLDYEDNAKRNVTFKVVAKQVSGTQSSSSTVNLYSRDINDNSPVFVSPEFTATITENLAIGSLVTTVKATDADISSDFGQPSIRYSIVENFDAARYLIINDITGEIRTSNNIDRESSSSLLKYTVQAIDKNGNYDGQRAIANLVINIIDINDDPPAFSPPSSMTFSMKEDAVTGDELTTVSASDKDDNPNLTFSINWNNSTFSKNRVIINNPDAEWKKSFVLKLVNRAWSQEFSRVISSVTASVTVGDSSLPPGNCNNCRNTPLDREKFDSVELCLTVTDNNTIENRNKDELYIVVNILDVNDNDPVFDVLDKEFFVVEGNATVVGTVFGSVRATDVDANNLVTYSLSSCDNVAIDKNNGQLSTTGLIDREMSDLIECVITATDSGSPTRSSSTNIKINVIDVNDNEPVLTVTPLLVVIPECSNKSPTKNGTKIPVKLTATDADTGAYGNVSYMLSQQNSEGVDEFAIDLYTGDMTVRNCELLDFDTKRSYSVVVEARDNYREGITLGSSSDYERINITLSDINDNAPTLPSPGAPNECYGNEPTLESLNMNDLVVSIQGTDKDSIGPNKWMTFTLHGQTRLGSNQPEKCKELFRLETVDNSTGNVLVNVPDMLDCTGNYDIIVQVCDQGDSIEGVQCSKNTTYRICVLDVNNNDPQFVFPESNNTVYEVPENSPVGSPLVYNGTNFQLTFKATDSDEGLNGQIIYTWSNDSVNDVFSLNKDSGAVTLNSELNRNVQSYYNLVVVATDKGVPSPRSSQMNVRINVRLSNKQLPYFESNAESLYFTENQMESKTFQIATDRDNINLYPGESPYDVCYYVVCGNSEYFDIPDKTVNKLQTKKTLDRENSPDIPYVIIYTTNDCTNKPAVGSCSEIDATKGQYLNVTIIILDVNDCDPEFSGSLSGGITEGDSSGTRVFPMTITDQDENDAVTCKIEEEFTVSQLSVGLANVNKPPFRIESDQWITLLFTVQPEMKGYFILNVTCQDKVKHSSQKTIKIYVVTQENKVDIVFDNKKEEIEAKRSDIETIFTMTMGFTCNIEKVIGYDIGSTQTGNSSYNSALSHFIDETKEEAEPVPASVIIAKKFESSIMDELKSLCREQGLTLITVGPLPTETNTSEVIFRILFIVACVVLVILIVILCFLFFSNSELKRRLAGLVARSSFGSQDTGRDGTVVPNSKSNPIFSLERSSNSNHDSSFDNMSQSSGDSILIGVENDPEFNSKKANGKSGYIEQDLPFTFQNVSRRNPLANDSPPEPDHPPPPPPPTQRSVKGPAPPVPVLTLVDSDQSDEDDFDSNFSFGDVTMTAI